MTLKTFKQNHDNYHFMLFNINTPVKSYYAKKSLHLLIKLSTYLAKQLLV